MDQYGVKPQINGRYDVREVEPSDHSMSRTYCDRRITLCLEHIVTVGLEYLQMHRKSRTINPFKGSATPIPDLDQNQKWLFINSLIPCSSI